MTQFVMICVYLAVFAAGCAFGIFGVLKATMGIRVQEEEELEGLDLAEHGQHAYDLSTGPGFLEAATAPRRVPAVARELATSEQG